MQKRDQLEALTKDSLAVEKLRASIQQLEGIEGAEELLR